MLPVVVAHMLWIRPMYGLSGLLVERKTAQSPTWRLSPPPALILLWNTLRDLEESLQPGSDQLHRECCGGRKEAIELLLLPEDFLSSPAETESDSTFGPPGDFSRT